MRVSEILMAMANWLESPGNEALLLAEYDENCLKRVAEGCVKAAENLRVCAEEVEKIEPKEPTQIAFDSLDKLAELATACDYSADPDLKKCASVLDELLLTIAAKPDLVQQWKDTQEKKTDVIKQRYEDIKTKLDEKNKVKESADMIDKSPFYEDIKIRDHALGTRYCPSHPGTGLYRVGEGMWQCPLDKKVFNYNTGFTTEQGAKIPPIGSQTVSEQTKMDERNYPKNIFDTREDRQLGYKAK